MYVVTLLKGDYKIGVCVYKFIYCYYENLAKLYLEYMLRM